MKVTRLEKANSDILKNNLIIQKFLFFKALCSKKGRPIK
jgi:hypothetical protein